jgi:predicted outer membrane lipoprotein
MILGGLVIWHGGYWLVWVVLGAAFGVLNTLLWRRNGAAHRWRASLLRRFPRT